MYALIFHDKGNEDQKAKFKTFEEAVEAACGIIVPQISEAVEREIESSEEEEGKAVQPETFEMLEILRNLYHHDHEVVERAIERWAKLAEADNFGDQWVELV